MKRRLFWTVLILGALILGAYSALKFGTVTANESVSKSTRFRENLEKFQRLNQQAVEKNKALLAQMNQPLDPSVTDDIALGIVLRFVSGNKTELEKNQVRHYMSDVLEIRNAAD